MPHVMEFGGILEVGKEIFVEINPEVTNADSAIRRYDRVMYINIIIIVVILICINILTM
jgi:hypothetical protein